MTKEDLVKSFARRVKKGEIKLEDIKENLREDVRKAVENETN